MFLDATYSFVLFALIMILIIPGPTNALLASASKHDGILSALKLIPAQVLGYVYAMGLWWLFIASTKNLSPYLAQIMHTLASFYIIWLAVKLWKTQQISAFSKKNSEIKAKKIFYTALKNPKALLFTIGIFPTQTWTDGDAYLFSMVLFCIALIPASLLWILFGQYLINDNSKQLLIYRIYRVSAVVIMLVMLPILFRVI